MPWRPLWSLRHPGHIGTPWDTFGDHSMESALITATSRTHWDTLGQSLGSCHGVRFDHCDIRDTLGHLRTPWDILWDHTIESALITAVTSGLDPRVTRSVE